MTTAEMTTTLPTPTDSRQPAGAVGIACSVLLEHKVNDMKKLKVLIACEYSGIVRDAFAARGHNAWSCDLLPTERDGFGVKHHQGDVANHLSEGWDVLIAHPPCTYLSSSGMHWTTRGLRDPKLTEDALDFVRKIMDAPCERICVENPVGIISTRIRKPDQIIQPYQYGEDASKSTCLWLKNLPTLGPGEYFKPRHVCSCGEVYPNTVHIGVWFKCSKCGGAADRLKKRWGNQTDSGQNKLAPSEKRGLDRAKTYTGIAEAMADQWTRALCSNARADLPPR